MPVGAGEPFDCAKLVFGFSICSDLLASLQLKVVDAEMNASFQTAFVF